MALRAAFYVLILMIALLGAVGATPTVWPLHIGGTGPVILPGSPASAASHSKKGSGNGAGNGSGGNSAAGNSSSAGNSSAGNSSSSGNSSGGNSSAASNGAESAPVRAGNLTTPTPTAAAASRAQAAPSATPRPVVASSAPADGGACWFAAGFKALHDLIPGVVGDCRINESHNPENGDGLQETSGGLLVWRKADNWTAFTNGTTTWLNGPCGLQTRSNSGSFLPWEGKPGGGCITAFDRESQSS